MRPLQQIPCREQIILNKAIAKTKTDQNK
jgi:hypothetical protein